MQIIAIPYMQYDIQVTFSLTGNKCIMTNMIVDMMNFKSIKYSFTYKEY